MGGPLAPQRRNVLQDTEHNFAIFAFIIARRKGIEINYQ